MIVVSFYNRGELLNTTETFSRSISAQGPEAQAVGEPGLRERQKLARSERILSAAGELFNSQGFEDTTMAAIARGAEVSTPTVFNYFKTKDELLLALVLQVHYQTREQVRAFEPAASADPVNSVCEFLEMYTRQSLQSISRKTWRHVESTRIRMPESDFVKNYDALSDEMLSDFRNYMADVVDAAPLANIAGLEIVAAVLFDHWSALFIELIRDEAATIDQHVDRLHGDLAVVLKATLVTA